MKSFMDKDFLLQTATAQELYHEHAEHMPIIDYHCHLIPQMVAENKRLPHPADGSGEQTFRVDRTDLAHGRPLQMARDAFQRCGRKILHG